MQIIFVARTTDGNQMRERATERMRFALRRLGTWVPHARVQFSDVNGPRGGLDKRCQVELSTEVAGTVVIASLASDWRTALDRSLRRATASPTLKTPTSKKAGAIRNTARSPG
jgi:hypothetical protein